MMNVTFPSYKRMGFISGDNFCFKGERKDGGQDDASNT